MSVDALSAALSGLQSNLQDIVVLTDAAVAKLTEMVGPEGAVRVGVIGGGCAGLQYDLKPCEGEMPGDFIQKAQGLKVHIHPVAAAYLKGVTIDYVDAMMDGGFKFHNPNAASTCGCGTSFGV